MDFEIQLSVIERKLLDIENGNDLVPFDIFSPPSSIAKADKSRSKIYKKLKVEQHGDYFTLPQINSEINRIFEEINKHSEDWIIDDLTIQYENDASAEWFFYYNHNCYDGSLSFENSRITAPLSKFPKNSLFARDDIVNSEIVNFLQTLEVPGIGITFLEGKKSSTQNMMWGLIEATNKLGEEPKVHFEQTGNSSFKNKYLKRLSPEQQNFIENLPVCSVRVQNLICNSNETANSDIKLAKFKYISDKVCFSRILKEKIEMLFTKTKGHFQPVILA